MARKSIFLLFFLIISGILAIGQTSTAYKSVKIDTTRKVTSSEVVKIAERFLLRQMKETSFDVMEKSFVDQEFSKLDVEGADIYKIAQGLSSTAVFFTGTGQSKNIPVLFSAKAVTMFPEDTLIINNFGAVLRMLDSVKTSVPVFLYAKTLCPNAPVILTNLGNSMFELYDDKSAESFYKKSLQINPDYALARHGLVNVYLKRKDIGRAMEELYKGVTGIYSESLADVKNKVKPDKKSSPPAPPEMGEPGEGSEEGGDQDSPNPNVPVDNLVLPEFPDWSEIGALLHDNSIEKISKKLTGIKPTDNALEKAMALLKMTPEQKQLWYENETRPGRILLKGNKLAMEMMEEYFTYQLKAADRNYIRSDSINGVWFEEQVEHVTANDEAKVKQLGADPAAYQAFLVERCNLLTGINDKSFVDWKEAASVRHKTYEDILMTYWVLCEQYLNRTYNSDEFEELNSKRKSYVASKFGMIYTDYSFRKLQFGLYNMASFASATGKCPQAPPPPEPPEEEEDDVNIPDKNAVPCPFKEMKLKIGLGVCSVGIDCESIEGECGEGLIAGAKWNYKKKELTLFGGAGLKADFGIKGIDGSSASASAKAGFGLTFNNKGQAIDASYKTEIGASATMGKYEAGQTLEVNMTAATGIDVSRTSEFVNKVF